MHLSLTVSRPDQYYSYRKDTFYRVVVSLRLLRDVYNSTLPAEVFSYPGEIPDEDVLTDLQELGAVVRQVDLQRDVQRGKNYQLKGAAVIQSRFQEVLFLDSDNYPANDPELLFEATAYHRLGLFFWPDYWKETPMNPVWQLIGVACERFSVVQVLSLLSEVFLGRDEFTQEAGVILIDKKRHMDVMVLVDYMLRHYQVRAMHVSS